jgi:hypothetical protein
MSKQWTIGLIIFFLQSALAAQAQTYMFGRANFPVGAGPSSIAMGDFNKDGIIDLAVVNEADNTVSILLGKPDGTFAAQVTYPTGTAPTAVVTGDFNGDGNLDLAVANGNCVSGSCNDGTVSILLGNGDGSFRTHVDYATGTDPSAVAAGDFNGDGKLDLAVTNAQDNTVSVLLGNGDGTLRTQVVYATASGPQSVIVADFNGDHKLDLAVGGSGVSVLLGNGDGTFQKQLVSPGGSPLAAADFNLDGKLDLFAGGDILLSNGEGTFVLQATTYSNGVAAAAVDLNGDGKPDLVIAQSSATYSGDSVSVLLGNGDGTFVGTGAYGGIVQYAEVPYPTDILVTDVNGDGKFDLVVAGSACVVFSCSTPGTVSILLGFGDGTFVGGVHDPGPTFPLIVADFNGDGKPDIAAEYTPIEAPDVTILAVFLGNGDGNFAQGGGMLLNPSCNGGGPPECIGPFAAGDFNGDGKADIALACYDYCPPGTVVVFIGNGDGNFQPPVEYPLGSQPANVAVGDFNGDGKPDLALSIPGLNTISILLNNGDGTFQAHVDYPTGAVPGAIAIGDFNGDGKLDVITATSTGFSLLPGKGDGTFGTHLDYPIAGGGTSLSAGDFNGDGKLDLAVGSGNSSQVFILLGNGNGTFQTPVGYATGTAPGQNITSDFNGDGKPDLLIGSNYIATILLGNGDGSFQTPIFSLLGGSFAVADFNQDGTPDVAASGYTGEYVSIAPYVMLSTAFKAISPASLHFGPQVVGTTSAPQGITISNPSNLSFDIDSIVASANFSQTNDCGGSLAPGAHCSVTASFTPTATGMESGAVTITDSTKISPLAIALGGTGVMNGPAPDFSIGAATGSPTSQTMSAGQSAKFSLAIAPVGSFTGTVNLVCKLSPTVNPAPTCTLSNSSVQVTGTSSEKVHVTVATMAPVTAGMVSAVDIPPTPIRLTWTVMLLGFGWFLLPARKRLSVLAAPLLFLALGSWVGCGGGGSSTPQTTPGTPTGTYTATVTATSGSLSHNTSLTVVVQ